MNASPRVQSGAEGATADSLHGGLLAVTFSAVDATIASEKESRQSGGLVGDWEAVVTCGPFLGGAQSGGEESAGAIPTRVTAEGGRQLGCRAEAAGRSPSAIGT